MEVGYPLQGFLILTGRTENDKGHVFNYQARTRCHAICRHELPCKQQRIPNNPCHCTDAHVNRIYVFCAVPLGMLTHALNQTERYGNFMHRGIFLARNICSSNPSVKVHFM